MSLVGNLEDLGLGDILQIVSLSRKSGVLLLQSLTREGKIIFQNGMVTRATSTAIRENVGDLLVKRGLTDVETIKQALLTQQGAAEPLRIGDILARDFAVDKSAIETIVKEQVEKIVYSFFTWSEGTFNFELGEPSEMGATSLNPLQFLLDQGLNPQWLAMEGSRILDEVRHRGGSFEELADEGPVLVDVEALLGSAFDAPNASTTAALAAIPPKPVHSVGSVLLVDDDDVTRTALTQVLEHRGFRVESCAHGTEFVEIVAATAKLERPPLLLVDLFMPRMDGSGILGGLELVELVRERYPALHLLVLSDHPHDDAEQRLLKLGIPPIIAKPKKNELRGNDNAETLTVLGDTLAAAIHGLLQDATPVAAAGPKTINFGADLLREMGESGPEVRPGKGPESPGLYLLRGMLQELNNPSLGGGIILLVLRFASELMNRAVIFLVKEQEIVGLGQFGIESTGELADVRVRRMKITRGEDSVFEPVMHDLSARKVRLGSSRWDRYLIDELGGGEPREVFIGPILSEGKVVALIYGDNLPDKAPIGDTESLEIFLSQAGLAMEKALLERRLRGKDAVL
jgi:CheY-like chemotaxis protein